ncbi:MAG: YidC/Oxa1 family membrane protein insertase [Cellulosilyticaceae bacterium]
MGIITNFFGMILNVIFELTSMLTPVGTLGISIIVFTIVAQLLLTPLKMKQQRSMRAMSRISPDLQKLQKKYANKKDQASQMAYSQEMQALYKKHNASPFAGCLPLIIQLPLIYGLYNVLRQPSRHIVQLRELYGQIANTLQQQIANIGDLIQQVLETAPLSSTATYELQKLGEAAGLSDTLSHFTTEQWGILETLVSPENFSALGGLLEQKHNFEWFLVNLVDSPAQLFAGGMMIALLIPIISGASTFIFSKITMASSKAMQQPATGGDMQNSTDTMMKVMNIMMPIMMGSISWTVPTGLALYWVAGNVVMMVQQIVVNRIVEKQEAVIDAKFKAEQEAEMAAKKKKKKKKKPPVDTQAIATEGQQATTSEAQKTKESNDTKQD